MPAEPTPASCRGSRAARFTAFALVALVAAVLGAPPAASASAPNYKGASANGEVVFFETDEQLVPGDTDTKRDIYERSFDAVIGAYVTREVSLGPAGGTDAYPALFEKASADGTKVFFSTEEALVSGDTDRRLDVYMRDLATGTTTLVSQGEAACSPACGNGAFDAGFARASADGTKAFFVTEEKLASGDTDDAVDVYERDLTFPETTTLVSAGASSCSPACGNGDFDASLRGLAPDASRVFLITDERLSGSDTDSAVDIYARNLNDGTTTLVSQGDSSCAPACGNSGAAPVFRGSSDDGSRVFFTTDEPLIAADKDTATDVYARDLPAGPTTLVSGGSSLTLTASFAAASADGTHVFFSTAEGLAGGDVNGASDVYEWSGGAPSLVTSGTCTQGSGCGSDFDASTADASTVLFTTTERLSGADTDGSDDIYEQKIGVGAPALVSSPDPACVGCGNGEVDARFNRASSDASSVVFTTHESLSPEDADGEDDIYARNVGTGETSLSTTSPSYCPLPKGNCGATFVDASSDGRHVFFTTVERFTLEDGDNEVDVYERFLGNSPGEAVTRLVSTGNSPDLELGPPSPVLEGTDPSSPASSSHPAILGHAQAGAAIKIYTTSNCSGEPAATGTEAQLAGPGIPVSVAPGSETSFWATAEAEGFVSLCSNPVSYTQQAASGGGGGGGSGSGSSSGGSAGGGTSGGSSSGNNGGLIYVTPHTRITFAPAAKTRTPHPVFRFTDATGQPGTSFSCKLDRKHWQPCGSPLRLKRVSRGRHVFEVRAVNALGAWEPTPAKRAFKLVPR
jgi:uncharacterized membrane protein YgcG